MPVSTPQRSGWLGEEEALETALELWRTLKTPLCPGDAPGSPEVKTSPSNAGDVGLIPVWGARSHMLQI